MQDETESYRRARQAQLNKLGQLSQEQQTELNLIDELTQAYGKVWDTAGLQLDFEALGFRAPFVVVRRKSDGAKGSLEFIHSPRLYFHWVED
jgi:hypothetical protein